jgi:hypothetical protein
MRRNFSIFNEKFIGLKHMSMHQDKNWLLGIVAFVALFTGSTMLFSGELNDQPESIQFSALSDADINMILAVKEEMRVASTK